MISDQARWCKYVSELVNWCGLKEWTQQWKVEQVHVGDPGLAVSSDLDLWPEQHRQQSKMGQRLFVDVSFPC